MMESFQILFMYLDGYMLSMPAGGLKEETETFGTNMVGARRLEVAAMQTVTDIICCLKQMDQI